MRENEWEATMARLLASEARLKLKQRDSLQWWGERVAERESESESTVAADELYWVEAAERASEKEREKTGEKQDREWWPPRSKHWRPHCGVGSRARRLFWPFWGSQARFELLGAKKNLAIILSLLFFLFQSSLNEPNLIRLVAKKQKKVFFLWKRPKLKVV